MFLSVLGHADQSLGRVGWLWRANALRTNGKAGVVQPIESKFVFTESKLDDIARDSRYFRVLK